MTKERMKEIMREITQKCHDFNEIVDVMEEQYEKAKNVIARHKEDEIPVFQSKGIGDYKMEDTVHESKDLDL